MMLELDRSNVLGTPCSTSFVDHVDVSHPRAQTPLERMQHFLTMVHDTTYHILGNAGPSLGRDFYQMKGLAPDILMSVFSNLEVSVRFIDPQCTTVNNGTYFVHFPHSFL
jgi:hypothetical protein